jgi:hypothetical protein
MKTARADAAQRREALGFVRHLETGLVDRQGLVQIALTLQRAGALQVPSHQPFPQEVHQVFVR